MVVWRPAEAFVGRALVIGAKALSGASKPSHAALSQFDDMRLTTVFLDSQRRFFKKHRKSHQGESRVFSSVVQH